MEYFDAAIMFLLIDKLAVLHFFLSFPISTWSRTVESLLKLLQLCNRVFAIIYFGSV